MVTAVEVFWYYLTGRYFTVVTDHDFKEPEGMVAQWIAQLQTFVFKIVLPLGKHHSHANEMSWCTSRPCKQDSCEECTPLKSSWDSNPAIVWTMTLMFPCLSHSPRLTKVASGRQPTLTAATGVCILPELMGYLSPHSPLTAHGKSYRSHA